jgi:chemotaxis signal transduction protein
VIVDEVQEVLTVDGSQLDSLPTAGSDVIDGIAKIDDRLVVLLDVNGIFAGTEIE